MKMKCLFGASMLAMTVTAPAFAQDAAPQDDADTSSNAYGGDIIVTAQRQSQSLQDVPVAVSAFSAEMLEKQQIENSSDLQLTLPNVTFTKTNFTSSSFTIRGIGDLCVGVYCDSATAIHINGSPLIQTRLFETEFFDLERIEVLRGPQGTLFGRNATSGVVNLITAKPDLNSFGAAADFEYGNYDAMKAKGMINIPIGETLAARVAGFYLKRDGYTNNLYDGSDIDGRDMYAVRGSLRWEPTDTTTIDLMGYYFREKDNRSRIQKQQCSRATGSQGGILGCNPFELGNGVANGNSTFPAVLTSRQFLAFQGIPTAFALGDLYGADVYANAVNPDGVRNVITDYNPTYFTSEQEYQLRIEQELGSMKLQVTGLYQKAKVDSTVDYNLSVLNRALYTPGLSALAAAAAGFIPPLPASYFAPIANALIPNGPGGQLCTSLPTEDGTGAYGGQRLCSDTPQDFDRSVQTNDAWSVEGILSSDWDGPFNMLVGGIYLDGNTSENSYYVNAFPIDYLSGILGAFNSLPSTANPAGLGPNYLGSPFFRNNTDFVALKSYGIFGEGYLDVSDKLKVTVGVRYNSDKKTGRARTTLASFLVPHGSDSIDDSPFIGLFDADPGLPGVQAFQERSRKFTEWTGRAVIDYKVTDDNLLYASYSRGYKSGGINPPLNIVGVPEDFDPELIDSFEIGSKNVFGGGAFIFNLTGFYYKYGSLQLSRIVNRTAVNDNVDATVWGVEAEAVIRPIPAWQINLGFSYLKSKVTEDALIADPRDPSGGRNDAVIIKDISNGAHCAVVPNTAGNAAGSNGFVTVINGIINQIGASRNGGANPAPLAGPAPFDANSGVGATGAYSICQILQAGAAGNIGAINAAFAPFQPLLNSFGVSVLSPGVPMNLRGNSLPQAPSIKFSAGAQYTHYFESGMSIVPRLDVNYTGDSYGTVFNGRADRIDGFVQANAQLQLNGKDDKWYVRGYVQNIFDSGATTGLYVSDASTGTFTNIFTLEPRRYGIAAGFKF